MMKGLLVYLVMNPVKIIIAETAPEKFKKWLHAPDPSTNHNSAREKRYGRTGQCVLEHDGYKAWKQNENSLLQIHGICELCFITQAVSKQMLISDSWLWEDYHLVLLPFWHTIPSL